jgi:hypothetical protein
VRLEPSTPARDAPAALLEVVSRHRHGLKDAEPNILGRSYEYLLRKVDPDGVQFELVARTNANSENVWNRSPVQVDLLSGLL